MISLYNISLLCLELYQPHSLPLIGKVATLS